jgi:hypothetical protein
VSLTIVSVIIGTIPGDLPTIATPAGIHDSCSATLNVSN